MESDAHRLAIRWWRRWTLLYLLLLTAGTHWPRLSLSIGEGPPPDKVLHLFAFGGLTLLLWQCRLIKNKWLLGLIVAVWVLFDEFTQSLPILHRESSWEDVIAGISGVACAIAWLWATAPLGGKLSRLKRQRFDQVVDERLSNLRGWIALGCRPTFYGLMSVLISCAFIDYFFLPKDKFSAALIAFSLALVFGIFNTFDVFAQARSFEHPRRRFTWLNGLAVGWLWALGIICVAVVGSAVLMSRGYDVLDIPDPLQTVAALAFLLVPVAFLVRGARRHWATNLERKSNVCHSCGYDLCVHIENDQFTVCPECGTPFARLHNEAETGR